MKFKTLLILPLFVASLQAATVEDLTFTLINGGTECSVSDCKQSATGILDIPSIYAGLPVTSIGYQAFIFCNSLSSITIPDSVTSIGDGAFSYCNSLNSITIPDSVTSIGDSAFAHCTSLTNIRFDGVAPTIGSQVFSYTQVSYIILEAANAATYGGDGANYGGLTVLDRSKIATAANLYTLGDIQDLRAGSTMIAVENGAATLSIDVEQSSDLGIWTTGGTASVQMNVQPGEDKKFFRFKMNDSDSSNKDINLSIEGSEYDEAAIIQALADQYGVPASWISLSVTGGQAE